MQRQVRRLVSAAVGTLFYCLVPCASGELSSDALSAVGPVPLSNSYRHELYSDDLAQTFNIDVVLPSKAPDGILPVVYVTDGQGGAPMLATSLAAMLLGQELPPMIIVGISYADVTGLEWMQLRTRDLTPTYSEKEMQETPWPQPEELRPGGADAFLDFIEDEVKPMIRSRYPAGADETLAGFSLGGLFTLHALFTRTETYDRYLAGSPSIWWDDAVLFSEEAAYAEENDDLEANLFLSVGTLEQTPDDPESEKAQMVTNLREMGRRLSARGYSNLTLTQHIFEGETHLSVIPATYSRGLRVLFAEEARALRAALKAPDS